MPVPKSSYALDHKGLEYTWVLERVHNALKPRTYFEIGTQTGQTLALATCSSLAVDPEFIVEHNIIRKKGVCSFYQDTSYNFFRYSSPTQFLGGPIDVAFLDGMHWYEYLLRDFNNTEAFCRPNSIIALHDCVPPDSYVGRRLAHDKNLVEASRFPDWWAGDVWKALLILRSTRPDLKIICFDAPPTGIVLITNLNPLRGEWRRDYYEQIENMRDLDLETYGINKLWEELDVRSTSLLDTDEKISSLFWL